MDWTPTSKATHYGRIPTQKAQTYYGVGSYPQGPAIMDWISTHKAYTFQLSSATEMRKRQISQNCKATDRGNQGLKLAHVDG